MRPHLLFILLLATTCANAQVYQVKTNQTDSFSQALVHTLQCAVNRFRDCQGDSIRFAWPTGTYFQLNHHFPGSTAEVITGTTYDRNVYVEFRGFPDKPSLNRGIYQLANQIKRTLGAQFLDHNTIDTSKAPPSFYMMAIQDQQGYFSSNIELFSGRSAHPSYLLTPDNTPATGPEENFILLKIYGGVPAYQFYVRPVSPHNQSRKQLFSILINAAKKDFDSLHARRLNAKGKLKKTDTLYINKFMVLMNYRGSNYAAEWILNSNDSIQMQKEWNNIQQDLQAALGTSYLYSTSDWGNGPGIVFFKRNSKEDEPRIYVNQYKKEGPNAPIHVRIESGFSRPTKAGLSDDDFD